MQYRLLAESKGIIASVAKSLSVNQQLALT